MIDKNEPESSKIFYFLSFYADVFFIIEEKNWMKIKKSLVKLRQSKEWRANAETKGRKMGSFIVSNIV